MRTNLITIIAISVLISAGCNGKSLEEQAQEYASEALDQVEERVNKEIFGTDSALLDTAAIKKKIAETTHADSLQKYQDKLKDVRNRLELKIQDLDSLGSEAAEILELNL